MSKKPNILLLILDGARNDALSLNGNKNPTTPFVDSLLSQGTYFRHCYSAGNCSLPSHISIFSGKTPYFHKASSNFSVYDGRYPLIMEILKEQLGYRVEGVSTENPYFTREVGFVRGFDHYSYITKVRNPAKNAKHGPSGQGFIKKTVSSAKRKIKDLVKKNKFLANKIKLEQFRKQADFYLHNDLGGQKIVEVLSEQIKALNSAEEPYFVFTNILEAHTPFLPLQKYRSLFGEIHLTDNLLIALLDSHRLQSREIELTSDELATLKRLYDCGLRYADDLVKDLFGRLKAMGALDDLVVFILSDHGEMLCEKDGLIGHGDSLYEGMIRVPLFCLNPKYFIPGKIVEAPCSTTDIFGTILQLTGAQPKAGTHPISLLEQNPDRVVVADHPPVPFPARLAHIFSKDILDKLKTERMIVKDKYKLIWEGNGGHQLYDLSADPREEKNIFSAYPEKAAELTKEMEKWYRDQLSAGETFNLASYEYNQHHETQQPFAYDDRFFKSVTPEQMIDRHFAESIS